MYLGAIVAANLTVAHFGPSSSIFTAFLFIGLDLTSRDKLHVSWGGDGLFWKMSLLIVSGSVISYLMNQSAGRIALASVIAFSIAAIVDSVSFHLLKRRTFFQRVNGSNVPAAAADSIIFPTIAFGAWMPYIIIGQFAAKVLGGLFWSMLISRGNTERVKHEIISQRN